jgi:spore maturation protein CgeB
MKLGMKQLIYDLGQKEFNFFKKLISQIPKLKDYIDLPKRPEYEDDFVDYTIIERTHPALFGLAMYQKLFQSKIVLNNHIDIAAKYASNMRLYEATGLGTCLLTDEQPDLQEIFEIDREIVTYNSVDECVEKVKWLLENPQEREAIAKAGQARTLKDHTFDQRAIQLDEIIRENL